jgi:hypothetical protein
MIKKFEEFINEASFNGIPWSGKNPTKEPIIGYITTKPMEFGEWKYPSEKLPVVEITDDSNVYIVNKWFKPGVPQVVHKELVEKYEKA